MENFENIFVVNIFGVEWVEEFRNMSILDVFGDKHAV